MVLGESLLHLASPVAIRFDEAIGVAVVGLAVNVSCALLLREHPDLADGEEREHDHHDHNLRAAYLHVLADGLTSLLAIRAPSRH
jgi:Co/Zn/Cd efflux system component